MSNIDFIDIAKEIELNKKAIENRIEKSGLTKEQIDKGYKLMRLEDKVLELDEDEVIDVCKFEPDTEEWHLAIKANVEARRKVRNMFYSMCKLLDFDYEELIEIQRLKEETQILEEVYEDNGVEIRIEGEEDCQYYLFGKGTIYSWTILNSRVKDLELKDVEDYILTNKYVKKAIETLF